MKIGDQIPQLPNRNRWLTNNPLPKFTQKPLLVIFWSISCNQCHSLLLKLNQFYRQYEENLTILGVHMPRSAKDLPMGPLYSFIETSKLEYPIYADHKLELSDAFGNRFVPKYYLFDEQGILRYLGAGENGIRVIEFQLKRLL